MYKLLRHIISIMLMGSIQQILAQTAMPDTVCVGTSKTYKVNDSSVPSTYTWKIDGIIQATITNEIAVNWKTAGTFLITVQEHSKDGCDGDIQTGTVYVKNSDRKDTIVTACSTFTWNRNNITYTTSGNYDYISSNVNGCTDTLRLKLTITPQAIPTFTQMGALCQNSIPPTLPLTSNNGITGKWNPAMINTSTVGTTTYTFTPSSGCAAITTMNITVNASITSIRYPTINATANITQQLQARIFSSPDKYTWNPAVGLNAYSLNNPLFNYDKTTEYFITIITGTGCTIVDTLLVKVFPASEPSTKFSDVFVPKAFSPNADGHNDKLTPLLYKIKEFKYFRIFNRWGQLIFETKIQGEGWDGTFKGIALGADVFTWTTEATGTDGVVHKKRGTTVLLR